MHLFIITMKTPEQIAGEAATQFLVNRPDNVSRQVDALQKVILTAFAELKAQENNEIKRLNTQLENQAAIIRESCTPANDRESRMLVELDDLRAKLGQAQDLREDQLQALGLALDDHTVIADEIRRIRDEGRDYFHELTKLQEVLSRAQADKEKLEYIRINFANAIHYCCRMDGDEWNTDFYGTLDKWMKHADDRKSTNRPVTKEESL